MKLYLAGPMRGLPDNNSAAFAEASAFLRSRGHEVWSPAENDEALAINAASIDIRQTFIRDLTQVLESDGIALLPDWHESHGACLERHTADVCGVPAFLVMLDGEVPLLPLASQDWRLIRVRRPVSPR